MVGPGRGRQSAAVLGAVGLVALLVAGPVRSAAPVGAMAARALAPVGAEHPVSDPIEGPSAGRPTSPATAFDGTNHLVVWEDSREGSADIYAARVTPSGVVLDPAGIPIATGVATASQPDVSYGGGVFLVVWTNASDTGFTEGDIFGARVDRDGRVLDPSGFDISASSAVQFDPSVAFGGGSFFVAWADNRDDQTSQDVFGTGVSTSGAVVGPPGIALAVGPQGQREPVVSYGGHDFLVAYHDDGTEPGAGRVSGSTVDPTTGSVVLAGFPITSAPEAGSPAIAFNGTLHLVVWTQGWDVFAARVTPSGEVLEPDGFRVFTDGDSYPALPSVTALGTTFLVGWLDDFGPPLSKVVGARVSSAGTVLDPAGIVIAQNAMGPPTLGSDGTRYFAVWLDRRYGDDHLIGGGIGADGSVLGPGSLIDRSANTQNDSDIGFDGANQLVVWVDDRGPGTEIYGARLNNRGERIDRTDIRLSAGSNAYGPHVAFDGANHLVVWTEDGRVSAARVSPGGYVLGRFQVPTSTAYATQAVASNGTDFLVVWLERTFHDEMILRMARITSAGVVLEPSNVELTRGFIQLVSVASDGQDYLVTWGSAGGVRGSRVAADGSVIGTPAFPISPPNSGYSPAAAWNGTRYLVVWTVIDVDGSYGVRGTRVTREGGVQDPSALVFSTSSGDEDQPDVASAGGRFLVVWRERRTDEDGIHGTHVNDDGALTDTPSLVIASGSSVDDPAVGAGPSAAFGVSFDRFVAESPYGADRVFHRTVAPK